jgi:hypothetical protein
MRMYRSGDLAPSWDMTYRHHPTQQLDGAALARMFAESAARCAPVLGRTEHLRMVSGDRRTRRNWAARCELPPDLIEQEFAQGGDWVVRARLLGAPGMPFAWSRRGLERCGVRSRAVVALREDCPDREGAELIWALEGRHWDSVLYALRLANRRGTKLRGRPATLTAILDGPSSWMEHLEVAAMLEDDADRAALLEHVKTQTDGSGRAGQDEIDYMHHSGPAWLREGTMELHDTGCYGCVIEEAEQGERVHRWLLPAPLAVLHGALDDVWPLYGRGSGEVLIGLLERSTQPFRRVVEAAGRLSGERIVAEVAEKVELDEEMLEGAGEPF